MNFGNEWTGMQIHKVREQELINQAENERTAKALRNEEEPRPRRIFPIKHSEQAR